MNIERAFAKIEDLEAGVEGDDVATVVDGVVVISPIPATAPSIEKAALALGRAKPDGLWKYFDVNGNLICATARWNDATGKKEKFFPISWIRDNNGIERFAFKQHPKPWPLYGLHELQLRSDCPVLVVEGEKCADAAREIFPSFVVITSPGGSGNARQADWSALKGRSSVMIWPDLDVAGADYAADVAAILSAQGIQQVSIVDADRLANEHLEYSDRKKVVGWDVADAVAEGHPAEKIKEAALAVAKLFEAASEANSSRGPANRLLLPYGYRLTQDGLTWADPTDDEKPEIRITSGFSVGAETRDHDGCSWGVLLRWTDHDGRHHQHALPRSSLAGDGTEARRILLDGGLYVAPGRKARDLLNSFLLQVRSPARARATNRVGWHGNAFVLPDRSFGEQANETLLLQTATAHEHAFRQSGTLADWKDQVAAHAVANSRLILAISAAFAAPLVAPCSGEGGGIHFRGASSTGKSTALHVAGSVWGGGDSNGYVRSWRATANGLEGVALGHCDTLLCLDEMAQLSSKDAGEAAYMLANGAGKSRSSRDGSARGASRWQVLFLSSGELGLADKVAEDGRGRKLAAGQKVRIVDVSADAGAGMGMFEDLHGFASPEIFARKLKSAAQQYYGVAGREYLETVVPDIDSIKSAVAQHMSSFVSQYVPAGADGQVERVAQRFSLIAAGGEIATAAGILPWKKGTATAAAAQCFADWLTTRGGIEPDEVQEAIEKVRAFIHAHGSARFIPAWEQREAGSGVWRDVAGYRQKTRSGWDHYVTTTAWKEEVCLGVDPRRAAVILGGKGLLLRSGKETRWAGVVDVPGHGKKRLYHLPATRWEVDDA